MSASDPISAIYVIDSAKEIKTKVCLQHIVVKFIYTEKMWQKFYPMTRNGFDLPLFEVCPHGIIIHDLLDF